MMFSAKQWEKHCGRCNFLLSASSQHGPASTSGTNLCFPETVRCKLEMQQTGSWDKAKHECWKASSFFLATPNNRAERFVHDAEFSNRVIHDAASHHSTVVYRECTIRRKSWLRISRSGQAHFAGYSQKQVSKSQEP
jgi:hypothetical protein